MASEPNYRRQAALHMSQVNSSSQPRPLSRKTGSRAWVAPVIGIGLFCVVVGVLLALWWRGGLRSGPDIAYTQFGPIRVSNQGYAMSATLSLQTGASDASWAKENSAPLQQALQQTLADTDVWTLRKPDGVPRLQNRLAQAVNAALPGSHVQRVFVTDLVYQSDDE